MGQSKPRRKKKKARNKKRCSKSPAVKNATSSSTYSVSPCQEFFVSSPSNFDSSISMISETWSPIPSPCHEEESWHFDLCEQISKRSSFILNWMTDPSFSSVSPQSSITTESASPDLKSISKLTVTMLSDHLSSEESAPTLARQASVPSGPKNTFNPYDNIDGLSVWTMESYTSTGTGYLSRVSTGRFSQVIQVKYPWSPKTNSDGEGELSPAYPSSTSSLLHYKYPSENELRKMRSASSIDTINWLGPTVVSHTEFSSFLDNIVVKTKNRRKPFQTVSLKKKDRKSVPIKKNSKM